MSNRAFLFLFLGLTILTLLTSPPVVSYAWQREPTPTITTAPVTSTATATITPDPFAHIPTATPASGRSGAVIYSLPTPILGALPPTFTPTSASTLPFSTPSLIHSPLRTTQSPRRGDE